MADKKLQMAFAAIDKQIVSYIPNFEEKETNGKNYISWGEQNDLPEYLYGLYTSVTTLRSIINGTADFICGDDATSNISKSMEINKKGDTLFETVWNIARDYLLYGNAFIQVIRNKAGEIGELYYIPARYIRASKKNDLFWYSEEFNKKYARSSKVVVYPKFVQEAKEVPASIIMLKAENDKTYAHPLYIASLTEAEIEKQLSIFNLSQIDNGFNGSYIFSFCNGIPSDEQKEEIEKNINEKFCGASNAGRILLNFCDSKDNGLALEKLQVENFAEKYNSAAQRASEQLYAAFGASPVLFGINNKTSNFNDQDYGEAFKLYNRTRVKPIQKKVVDLFDKIYGVKGSISIKPYSIDWSEESDGNNETNIQ